MIKCGNCNVDNPADAVNCGTCGTMLAGLPRANRGQRKAAS
jgi:hypothetical protein